MFAVRSLVAVTLLLVLGACATTGEAGDTATTITIPITTTSTMAPATTVSTVPALQPCDPPGFLPSALPERVIDDRPDVSAVPLDELTLQAGTIVTGWTDAAGNPVLAMVRGALPPTRWITTPEEIDIRGVKAAVGELGDGIWAVAWFEGPDRCDEYYLVFYPPTGPEEAKTVAGSLTGSG